MTVDGVMAVMAVMRVVMSAGVATVMVSVVIGVMMVVTTSTHRHTRTYMVAHTCISCLGGTRTSKTVPGGQKHGNPYLSCVH